MTHQTEIKKTEPHIIVIGCGRLGAELAVSLSQKKFSVAIVDSDYHAFERLGNNFRGQTVEGEGFDQEILRRAGIENAYGFTAVTTRDSINIITCRIARDIYHVPRVVARLYNPSRATIYQKLNLQTIASSSWGAQRVEQMMINPGLQSVYAVGNGEVHVYEMMIPESFANKRLQELITENEVAVTSLTRAGRAQMIKPEMVLEARDLLLITATSTGARKLQTLLETGAKE